MITKIMPIEELKQIFTESMLNNTNKVTKVSDGSVLNGISYGISKLSQKILKDVAIVESHLFPDTAVGEYLDNMAKLKGVAARLTQTKSTVFARVVGEPGTVYTPGTQVFTGSGMDFDLLNSVEIPSVGYTYVNLVSQQSGAVSNIAPLTLTKVNPKPVGHQYVINEFSATGGRNNEGDDDFRKRIKDEINVISRGTISYLEQVFRKFEPDVLRVMNLGLDNDGDLNLAVCSVNGIDFTTSQLSNMLMKGEQYLSMNELKPNGLNNYGVKIKNVSYYPIDISFRVDIDNSYNVDLVRKDIQIAQNKVADFRYWEDGGFIDWIDLINCVKTTKGVKRVLDNFFYPNTQFLIPRGKLPRIRGFQMMDLQGNILVDLQGNLNPVYYPNINDFAYQATILKSL